MTTQEILTLATQKANDSIAKGCKLPFEKVLDIFVKQITKTQTKEMTSKDVAKMEVRNSVQADKSKAIDMSDYYAAASKRQAGSSMRY